MEALLLAPVLRPTMEALQHAYAAALATYGLEHLVQIEDMVVDRLEDEEDAVVLVGADERAYLLPRSRLRAARLERAKASGVLLAAQTGDGIFIDVWPAIGSGDSDEWRPDPAPLSRLVQRALRWATTGQARPRHHRAGARDGPHPLYGTFAHLPPRPDTPVVGAHRSAADLIARALPPAPEARLPQSCFGTQVYEFDPAGAVTLVQAARPAFLDACLVPAREG